MLTLKQPAKGYRAGIDPVLLAASVRATAGQSVLELGCGVGAAMLCLGARVPGLLLNGVELQPDYANLCRENAASNGMSANVWTTDLRALPAEVLARNFDHVIANPPYFDRASSVSSPLNDRDIAFAGETLIADWIETATRRLTPKGWLSVIHKADRLPDILRAMDSRLGSVAVFPITGRTGRVADRIILRARKGGRTPFKLHSPIPLHVGLEHLKDAPDYRPEIVSVLRGGAEFKLPD